MAKLRVSERKYWNNRIHETFEEQIRDLRQQNAADVQQISEKAYNDYLKALKINSTIKEYGKLKAEVDILSSRIIAVFEEVRNNIKEDGNGGYDYNNPSLYSNPPMRDIDKAYRWACGKTAQKQECETPAGKQIKILKSKRTQALDILHGVDELDGFVSRVNKLLKGTDVPLLGK